MKIAWAFLKRDLQINLAYRVAFLIQLGGIVLAVPFFFFFTRITGNAEAMAKYDGNYFAFILIGIALLDYMGISLQTFSDSLRESQLMGTLEIMLLSPTSLPKLLLCSSLYGYLFTSVRFMMFIVLGLIFGLDLKNANWPAAFLILILAVIAFAGMGILVASITMIIKRGHALTVLVSAGSLFFAGVVYPTEVIQPAWLQNISLFLPITFAADGMRMAMIKGATISSLIPQIITLAVFGATLVPLGIITFVLAVKHERVTGAVAQY